MSTLHLVIHIFSIATLAFNNSTCEFMFRVRLEVKFLEKKLKRLYRFANISPEGEIEQRKGIIALESSNLLQS